MQAVESYRMWPEGPGFESRSPRIAQARVRLATNTLPQTPHRAGALRTRYALFYNFQMLQQSYFHDYVHENKVYEVAIVPLGITYYPLDQTMWTTTDTVCSLLLFLSRRCPIRNIINRCSSQWRIWGVVWTSYVEFSSHCTPRYNSSCVCSIGEL